MAGATGKAAAQVNTRSRMDGHAKTWPAAFFVLTQSTALTPGGAQPETTMTKRIGTGASLADFTRRDFLASSALTAALFTAALLLFPVDAKTESKDLTVAGPVSLHAPMPRR